MLWPRTPGLLLLLKRTGKAVEPMLALRLPAGRKGQVQMEVVATAAVGRPRR